MLSIMLYESLRTKELSNMNFKVVTVFLLGFAVAACDGGDRASSKSAPSFHVSADYVGDGSDIVATVNDQPITKAIFQQEMRFRGAHIQARFDNEQGMNDLLDEVIQFELFAQKAIELDYHKDPETALAIKKLLVHKFKQKQLDSSLNKIVVNKSEIENVYKAKQSKYSNAEMARAAIIYLQFGKDEKENQSLHAKARTIRDKAMRLSKDTKGFGELAQQYSDDVRTKYKNGLMSWTSPKAQFTQWPAEVINAIFKIENIGDISPVIKTKRGMVLLRLVNKREQKIRPLNAVSRQIKNTLMAEKKRDWLKKYYQTLKTKADIKIDEKKLKEMQAELSKHTGSDQKLSQPPRFPIN